MTFLETQAPCLWRACCWLMVGTRHPRPLLLPDSRYLSGAVGSLISMLSTPVTTNEPAVTARPARDCSQQYPQPAQRQTVWMSGSEEVLCNCSRAFTLAAAREPELGLTGARLTCARPALCSAWAGKTRCRPERTSRGVCTGSCVPCGQCPSENSTRYGPVAPTSPP